MTEEAIFLRDILSRPDDEVPRLIYADWLDDRADPRCQLVRLGWALRDSPPTARNRASLEANYRAGCKEGGWIDHDGVPLPWDALVLVFRFRLADAMAFCTGRRLPLRTWDLDPRTLIGRFDADGWLGSPSIDWGALLVQLGLTRRRLLAREGKAPERLASNLLGGRIVLVDPTRARSDIDSLRYSDGYFDEDDLPPWDTWILDVPEPSDPQAEGKHYLLAWVPAPYLQRARAGIEVSESGGLYWADQTATPFIQRLREAGMLAG